LSLIGFLLLAAPALGHGSGAGRITLERLGTYTTGLYGEVAAEIAAYDPVTRRLFVSNDALNRVDVIDMTDPRQPFLLGSISIEPFGREPTSVAFSGGLGVSTAKAEVATDPGSVVFFNADGAVLSVVQVGVLPDCLAFTPDGKRLVIANEGEPAADYTVDPEGTVSVIDIPADGTAPSPAQVRTADFRSFNGEKEKLLRRGVRIYGPTVAPKYGECVECTPEACPAVADCAASCTEECEAENCPQAGVAGRDPGDLAPEGLLFIPAEKSPAGFGPLLVVTSEVSGSTTIFAVRSKQR